MRHILRRSPRGRLLALMLLAVAGSTGAADGPDLSSHPRLYVVGYAHLDTQWRWEYPQTIGEFLPKTLHDNFALFERYPHYVFNFSGANRYRMIKEYYPADYAKLKEAVAAGRWFPAGSSMEEGDVNSPNAESIVRQILYGTHYFRHEFGKTSAEYMLPDCFGFPASLPSILAHMGLKGFSTQKLSWGSAAPAGGPDSSERTPEGVPFNVGLWEGPDGSGIIAALNPGNYSGQVREDISKSPASPADNPRNAPVDWPARVQIDGKASGLLTDYHYYGTGDTGGSPRESSVKLVEAIVTKSKAVLPGPLAPGQFGRGEEPAPSGPEVTVGDGPLEVVSATAEQMFLDIKPEQAKRLPRYKGDLLLTNHSAGSISSQAYRKRWNRQNEVLADAAERASVAAAWLGGRPYPLERLNAAWTLVMGGQFHDILPGTATPRAFEFSWNDDVLAMNQFASVLTSATEAVSQALDTQAKGAAVVVYNPLNIPREDVVEATVSLPTGTKAARVTGPDGKDVPAQVAGESRDGVKVLFLAKLPSVGYAVYDVQAAASASAATGLQVSESGVENARYRIQIDRNGDVASLFDKSVGKELLASPARLALQTEKPHDWPAWNMDWEDQRKPPRGYVEGPAKLRVVEKGPVRVALEVTREAEGSVFTQTVRLAAGDAGERVELGNVIDWKTPEAALKATFPLSAANPQATYNWDVGTVLRGTNDEKKFEVPSHQWFDLTDAGGGYGVTVLSDCKNASDKPDDHTLRLTLVYTPGLGEGNGRAYSDQTSQDWGHHEFVYGLAGHAGDWRRGKTDWQAYRLNEPPIAFESPKHPGALGRSFSLLGVSNDRVRVLALKKAEESDEVIVRVVEQDGAQARGVRLSFAGPLASAREVNGQEQPVGPATVTDGALVTDLGPYQLRAFAVKLSPAATRVNPPQSHPITLAYDRAVATRDGAKPASGFDAAGNAIAAEMLPSEIDYSGVRFHLAPAGDAPNALVPHGQKIPLPSRSAGRLYVLAASAKGDQSATFRLGATSRDLVVQDWGGFIGQWDTRTWNTHQEPLPTRPGSTAPPRMRNVMEYAGLKPGFIKRAPVAWFSSHHHTPEGTNSIYEYSYLFAYALDVPAGTDSVTLPDNGELRILAITMSDEGAPVQPAQPLYDTLERASR
jgi:alpha-mannosidase